MGLAKCVATSQRKDVENGLRANFEGCGGACILVYSIALSCGIGRGQMRGDRPMRVAKCDGRSNCWALGQRGSNIASGLRPAARSHSHLTVIPSKVKVFYV